MLMQFVLGGLMAVSVYVMSWAIQGLREELRG